MVSMKPLTDDEARERLGEAGPNGSVAVAEPPEEAADPNEKSAITEPIEVAQVIKDYAENNFQFTRSEVRAHCKGLGISTDLYQKGFTYLLNVLKLFTEVPREDGSKAYEIKRTAVGVPVSVLQALVENANAPAKKREVYGKWRILSGTITCITPVFSSRPVVGNMSARKFVHAHIGGVDNVVIMDRYWQAMIENACQKPGAPDIGTARYRIQFDTTFVDAKQIVHELNPVPPSRPGLSGQGVTDLETLPEGTEIPFRCVYPESHVTPQQMRDLLSISGRWVGISPSAAHKGWGRFVVNFADDQELPGAGAVEDDASE